MADRHEYFQRQLLLTEEQLLYTPSQKDGITSEQETSLREFGAELIQQEGILLQLPQIVIATGQVIFHRLYFRKSFKKLDAKSAATSCLFLAAKVEENQRHLRDFINVYKLLEKRRNGLPIKPVNYDSEEYSNLKYKLIHTERLILKELGFILYTELPHKFLLIFLDRFLNLPQIAQKAWNYMIDSYRSTVILTHKPETIACAAIYLAARSLGIPLPDDIPWWSVFSVHDEDILDVCTRITELYKKPAPTSYINVIDEPSDSLKWDCPITLQTLAPAASEAVIESQDSAVDTISVSGDSKELLNATASGSNTTLSRTPTGDEASSSDAPHRHEPQLSEQAVDSKSETDSHRSRNRERDRERDRDRERRRDKEHRGRRRSKDRSRSRSRSHSRERRRDRERKDRGRRD